MTVNDKFEEAVFFLEKLKEPLTAIEIRHYYSAFLTAVSSIFDHMLEDANNKFLLGIPLNERLNSKNFRIIVEYLGNVRAKKFIDWYDDVFNLIRKKESGKIFHVERNRNVHRRKRLQHSLHILKQVITKKVILFLQCNLFLIYLKKKLSDIIMKEQMNFLLKLIREGRKIIYHYVIPF